MNALLTATLTRHDIPTRWYNHWHRIEHKFGTARSVEMLEYDQAEIVRMQTEDEAALREMEREQVAA